MRERPILFNAAMVRAILAGRKMHTRRAVKPQPSDHIVRTACLASGNPPLNGCYWEYGGPIVYCPFGQRGDRLWVRETWAQHGDYPNARRAVYRADAGAKYDAERWHPSIHMPRWACRLVLEITDVRVERLQSISEANADAEGADPITASVPTYRDAFRYLWEDAGGDWVANPWVWVIGFRPVEA